mgnify:CR=1 FL=1
MYKACIFDLDGTLANTLASIALFANHALRGCGYPEIPVQTYRRLVGNGRVKLLHNMLDTVAPGTYTEDDIARVGVLYDRYYAADPGANVQDYPGIPSLLQNLRAAGLKIGVLSNKPDDMTQAVLRRFPKGTFDAAHGQRAGVPRKPAPDGALLLAKELGAAPAACLYIGDTNTDMQTGAAAGMDTVGVLWGFRDREELQAAHACALAEKPADILSFALHGVK